MRWKIADFGATAEGTSKRLQPTSSCRGTASYRAPEVLEEGGYSAKSDIWVFGCIAYELIAGERAFRTDWDTMQYCGSQKWSPKRACPVLALKSMVLALIAEFTKICVDDCLKYEWTMRPSALQLLEALSDVIWRTRLVEPIMWY